MFVTLIDFFIFSIIAYQSSFHVAMKIVLIGAGNLASSLAPALKRAGHTIPQVYSRTLESASLLAEKVGAQPLCDFALIRSDADVYIYALRDEVYKLMPAFDCRPDAVHLLTSGSVPYTDLKESAHRGVMYPFQSFSKSKPQTDFSSVPVMIEGEDERAVSIIRILAESISGKVYDSTPQSRVRLHLAGVLANNFTNCMYALAEEQLRDAGLPFDILLPLIDETAAKVHFLSPREAQTGPASRHDFEVMKRQLLLLPDEEQRSIYTLVSENIIKSRR